jgi:hypothetical protein
VAQRNAEGVRWLIERKNVVNAKRAMGLQPHRAPRTHRVAERLIELTCRSMPARPNIGTTVRGDGSPGWAEFCGQPQIAELLRQRGATT